MSAGEIARLAVENVQHPEPPRPLMRAMPPADPFPVDALGRVLGDAAAAIHDKIQAPIAICAQSVLAAATLTVQAHADAILPYGQSKPLSEYFVTIGATGERKSACDSEALWPVHRREAALREIYGAEFPGYQNAKRAWDVARKVQISKAKGDHIQIKAALDGLGPEPDAPLHSMLTCTEPTFEGLCRLFAGGHPSLGIFSAEGGQFVGGHGMNADNRLKTAAAMSSLWDGDPIKRVRVDDGCYVLPGRRLTTHLMMQPNIATEMLGDAMLLEQGLISRFLVTAPEPASGTRFQHDPDPGGDAALKRYGARLLDIFETPLPLVNGKRNELDPRRLPLAQAAILVWKRYADHVERALSSGGSLEPIRGLANKLPEHAARLAVVLALVDNLDAGEVSRPYVEAGMRLAEHYSREALRLFHASRIDPKLIQAQKLLTWLAGWPEPMIGLPEIYQRGPNAIRDKKTAMALVDILVGHGWLIEVSGGAEIAGIRRREAWRICREG